MLVEGEESRKKEDDMAFLEEIEGESVQDHCYQLPYYPITARLVLTLSNNDDT